MALHAVCNEVVRWFSNLKCPTKHIVLQINTIISIEYNGVTHKNHKCFGSIPSAFERKSTAIKSWSLSQCKASRNELPLVGDACGHVAATPLLSWCGGVTTSRNSTVINLSWSPPPQNKMRLWPCGSNRPYCASYHWPPSSGMQWRPAISRSNERR